MLCLKFECVWWFVLYLKELMVKDVVLVEFGVVVELLLIVYVDLLKV